MFYKKGASGTSLQGVHAMLIQPQSLEGSILPPLFLLWFPAQICWLCHASKGADNDVNMAFTNASDHASFWATYLVSKPWVNDPPYAQLPGFSIDMICPDLLHVVNLGVAKDVCGCIMKVLVKESHVFGGTSIEEKLQDATVSLRAYARAHTLPLRMKKFSKKKLNWKSNSYPELRTGSGYDVAVISKWLQHVLLGHQHIYPQFATLLWALNNCLTILYAAPWFLSEEDRMRIRTMGSIFMRVYLQLSNDALSMNEFMWRCRPKLHILHHIFKCHRSVNMAKYSTWMDEDFLKKISKTLGLVSALTAQERVLQRWLLALPSHLQNAINQ